MSESTTTSTAATHLIEASRRRVQAEADAVAEVARGLDASFIAAVDLVHGSAGKVLATGVGTSGPVARRMAHLLSTTGTPALFLHPGDALHGSLGAVAPGDVVVALSKGGKSAELNEFAQLACARGARLLCITAVASSPLADLADVTVVIAQTADSDPGGIVAMGSSLAVAAWGDALAMALMELSGYSWDEVLRAHPSGAVGQLSGATDDEHAGDAMAGPDRNGTVSDS